MDFRVFSRNISENMHARCVREDTKQALKENLQADGVQSRQTLFVRYYLNNYKKTPPDLLHWQRSVRITNLPFFANQLDCSAVFAINLNIGKRRNADQIHTDRSKIAAGNGNCFYCLICRTSARLPVPLPSFFHESRRQLHRQPNSEMSAMILSILP